MSDETAIESLQYIMGKYQDSTITLACTRAIEEIVESKQEEMDLNRRINVFKAENKKQADELFRLRVEDNALDI